ncbi:hypothetical protein B0H10DRAFT_2046086 [Mycena sp. CBHHK59/15]|nr:hypothetical protein B0H10DRAFT_2046086 [Mycena sp. CBHHK59/15]
MFAPKDTGKYGHSRSFFLFSSSCLGHSLSKSHRTPSMPPNTNMPFSVAGMASTSSAHTLGASTSSAHGFNTSGGANSGSTWGTNSGSTWGGAHNSGGSTYNSGNMNTWGGNAQGAWGAHQAPFADTLAAGQRSHYQPGYLMSASQSNTSPTAPRTDDAPLVPTKAKMSHRGGDFGPGGFGMDSMFQSARQRQPLADEDAPPTSSVNDIPTEAYADSGSSSALFQPRTSAFTRMRPATPPPSTPATASGQAQHYIIIFGYPPDKYSAAVAYFAALGGATPVAPHLEVSNCFRMGFASPADAARAVRKSGEVLEGSWMVGVRWADPAQAEALLGQSRSAFTANSSNSHFDADADSSPSPHGGASPSPMAVDAPTVGTPLRLAPSASAFRRAGANTNSNPTPTAKAAPVTPSWGTPQGAGLGGQETGGQGAGSPQKGVLGQVSDMIFGW